MRYITIPGPIVVSPPPGMQGEPESLSFKKAATILWLNDDRAISGGFDRVVRWSRVVTAILDTPEGSVVALEDADHAQLAEIVKVPSVRMPPLTMVALLPFSRAVLDAPEKDPRGAVVVAQGNGAVGHAEAT